MNLIVAVDSKWGIGYNGDLLVRIRGDLSNFASLTSGKIVVLGSNTLATFPNGRVLKNRTNIVLNPDVNYAPEGAIVVHSLNELARELGKYNLNEVFVIGGASVYRQLLPYCAHAYVTQVDANFRKDAFFTDLDDDDKWRLIYCGEEHTSDPSDFISPCANGKQLEKVTYRFNVYGNLAVKPLEDLYEVR